MNQTKREKTGALGSTIEVYLFRGAFCLLLFGICAISIALAQRQPEGGNLDVNLANAPVVTTHAATNVTSTSATLNETVNPNGLTTSVFF
jgi:hypothetical protein